MIWAGSRQDKCSGRSNEDGYVIRHTMRGGYQCDLPCDQQQIMPAAVLLVRGLQAVRHEHPWHMSGCPSEEFPSCDSDKVLVAKACLRIYAVQLLTFGARTTDCL
jgi:hypothetical protein